MNDFNKSYYPNPLTITDDDKIRFSKEENFNANTQNFDENSQNSNNTIGQNFNNSQNSNSQNSSGQSFHNFEKIFSQLNKSPNEFLSSMLASNLFGNKKSPMVDVLSNMISNQKKNNKDEEFTFEEY